MTHAHVISKPIISYVIFCLALVCMTIIPSPALAVTYRHCEGLTEMQCSQDKCGPFMCGITVTCAKVGTCSLYDLMQVVYNIGNFILMLAGTLTLLMFTIGGVMFLTSHGNPEGVTKGKNYIKYSTVGLLIVFSAYALVFTLRAVLTTGSLS